MANAVKGLLSDSLEVRRVASATLAQAGELGGIYLRKALRGGPADAIGPTAELLARAKDPNTPAILLAKLRADAADKVRAAAMPPLTRLIDQTAAGEFRRAHALALSASGAAQLDWLDYFLAVLDRRCGGTGAKLDELLAMGGAYEKLQAAAKVAWESSDPALVARASRHAGAFGLAVGRGHCLLWLRADRGVELNAAGRVVRWRDQAPRKGHAVQTAETQWPRIETVGERRFVKFDGLNDHLVLPKGFADFSKGVTMALWARPSGSKKWGRFLDLGNGSGVDNIVLSRSEATGDLAFQVYLGAQAGKVIAAKAIEQGTWHHYVATQDETGQVVLYRDAKQVATQKIPPAGKPVVKKLNYIARSNWPNDEYYGGLMDDLRVFDRALSAAEVRMIFQRTQQRYMVN